MTRFLLLDNDETVVNVIEADSDFTPPDGLTMIPAEPRVGIGWRRRGRDWQPPDPTPEPEPEPDRIEVLIDTLAAKGVLASDDVERIRRRVDREPRR